MLISLNWIRDFTDVPSLPGPEIGRIFTLATAEVEQVITPGLHLKTIRVVETVETNAHPNSDKLKLVKFKTAEGDVKEVVCGAPNVRPGLKVAFAPVGTIMPNGMILEPKKIRDVVSHGMLCSEAELGVGEDHDGIWELPEKTAVGKTLAEVLGITEDTVLEVDNKSLTHRPDLWGHYGMAREFSTVFKTALKDPFDGPWQKSITNLFTNETSTITPEVQGETSCLGYFGLSIDNVKVEESPSWIKERITAAGLRPINNMVDIGNYVMLELGMPLHIFDRDKIRGSKIIIHQLQKESSLKLLNEETAVLQKGDTIISDTEGPTVVAGIIGGEESGVSEKTTRIFIETANWKAAEVRRLSTRLGIRTDSSQRFEKSLDSLLLERTILRAASLVLKLYPEAKIAGKLEYTGPKLGNSAPLVIKTSTENICRALGTDVSEARITEIFDALDFRVAKNNSGLLVTVPSYRAAKDIEFEADLVEEIGRIIGYDSITPKAPEGPIIPMRLSSSALLHRKLQDFFVLHARALEIQTYPMVGEDLLRKASWPDLNEPLKIKNPLSQEADRMRPSIIPSLLEAVALNQKTFERFSFFELGRSYLPDQKNFSLERRQLGFVIFDRESSPFLEVLNKTEDLFNFAGFPAQLVNADPKFKNSYVPNDWRGIHPTEQQTIRLMGKLAGAVFSVHPALLSNYKVRGHVALALLDYSDAIEVAAQKSAKYVPISRFPASDFDCTVVAGEHVAVGDLLDVIRKLKLKEIQNVKIASVFPLSDGKKAVSLRSTFCDRDATLSAKKIKELEKAVLAGLEKAGFPLR